MQEQAEWRAAFPWRDVQRRGQSVDANAGGPIVELPGRGVVMIEPALAGCVRIRSNSRDEKPAPSSQSAGGSHPSASASMAKISASGRRISRCRCTSVASHKVGKLPACEPDRHVEPCQPEIPPDQTASGEGSGSRNAILGIGGETVWRHRKRRRWVHCAGRGAGHPTCSSTSCIGSAKMSSAKSSKISIWGLSPDQTSPTAVARPTAASVCRRMSARSIS